MSFDMNAGEETEGSVTFQEGSQEHTEASGLIPSARTTGQESKARIIPLRGRQRVTPKAATARTSTPKTAAPKTVGPKTIDIPEQHGYSVDPLDKAPAGRKPHRLESAANSGRTEAESSSALLSFLQSRLTGQYTVDEFGFDSELTENVLLPLLRLLYEKWFRVETYGVENLPLTGGGLIVCNHSGTLPLDALMTAVAVHDKHPRHRHLRGLGADLLFQLPVIGSLARKSGQTLACNPDAERLLRGTEEREGELVGVWPEGFKGIGKPFSSRYKLQRFGRGGFVSAALRSRVPIIPCSIVGAEEIYPKIGDIKPLARLLGIPYFPVTPFFPLLGPLGAIPLPTKWHIEFGEPIRTDEFPVEDLEDPMLMFTLTDQVRESIQQSLYRRLSQRQNVFKS